MKKVILALVLGLVSITSQAEPNKKGFGYLGLNLGMAGGYGITGGAKSVSNTEVPSSVAQMGLDTVYLFTNDETNSSGFGLSASYFTYTVEGKLENISDGGGRLS